MRITSDNPAARDCTVLLDQVELKYCVEADEEAGRALCAIQRNGTFVNAILSPLALELHQEIRDDLLMEWHTGRVEIIFASAESRAAALAFQGQRGTRHPKETTMDDAVKQLGNALVWDALTRVSFFGNIREAIAEAEQEIARRGLQIAYLEVLFYLVGWGTTFDLDPWGKREQLVAGIEDVWALFVAPPELRVQALLQVVQG